MDGPAGRAHLYLIGFCRRFNIMPEWAWLRRRNEQVKGSSAATLHRYSERGRFERSESTVKT